MEEISCGFHQAGSFLCFLPPPHSPPTTLPPHPHPPYHDHHYQDHLQLHLHPVFQVLQLLRNFIQPPPPDPLSQLNPSLQMNCAEN